MDYSPPGTSVHRISQARILECTVLDILELDNTGFAISFSRESSDAEIEPRSSALQADTLPSKPPGKLSDMTKKSNREAKVKRIQHHQTSFITNAKGTSPDTKHKRRKRPTQHKPKAIKKMAIGS